ncbi:MAG: beta-N-acetylhexosaminidase [Spirochaetes bacterium]|nr:beta-N-acetylhexosaminidase [Spirochaetota bacterium]
MSVRLHPTTGILLALSLLASCTSVDNGGRTPVAQYEEQQLPLAEIPRRRTRERLVDKTLEEMSLEQLVGQRFVTWLAGPAPTEKELHLAREGAVGGFIVYPRNVVDRAQVTALTTALQRAALSSAPPVGLLLAADQEGGRVAALRLPDMPQFPPARSWTQHDDPDYVEASSYVINRELASVGINANFAPVLDVYEHGDESIIGDRAFSDTPELVGTLGRAYLAGAERAGVIAVPKHFPGHGSTAVDSHGELPVVLLSREELYDRHLPPFRAAVDSGAPAMMTAHLLLPAVDPRYPATLSQRIITGILREELGFDGVVISDGVAMGAISRNYDVVEAVELSMKAGVDIILVHARYDVDELVEATVELVRQRKIPRDDVEAATRRVLELKARYGLLPPPP